MTQINVNHVKCAPAIGGMVSIFIPRDRDHFGRKFSSIALGFLGVQLRINIVTGPENTIALQKKRSRDNSSEPIIFNSAQEEIMLDESTVSKW